jgi:MFS transporter, ACS family, D-galactonate transporter
MGNGKPISAVLWRVLVLLVLSIFINYVDRGNLSIAAPLLKGELGLSASQLGILLSAFFWTYSFFLLASGFLADHFEVKWVLAAGFLLWSAATLVTGLLHGFVALLLARFVLGIGESTAYPSYSRILARYFPEQRRGLANALIGSGKSCGPALGTFAGSLLMASFGWRPFFIVLGLASLLWLVPWLKWMPREPRVQEAEKAAAPGMVEILRQPSLWGTCGGLFGLNYLSYFMITWLPYYLVHERHFSLPKMGQTIGLAYLFMALAAPASGWVEDRLIAHGQTPTLVRKTFMALGQAAAGVFLAACVVADPRLSVIFLFLAATAFGVCDSNTWAITQTLAGPRASGKWTGFQNFFGNLAGIAAPAIAGFIVDKTGNFFWAFALTGFMAVLGSLCWVLGVGPLREVTWKRGAAAQTANILEA